METLESSRVCRLCGKHSGICINIFDKDENHVKKINAVLPILVHEMDLLPKQMCHRCSYKLEEFHKFYTDCLKTDVDLKSQLSWMRKRDVKEDVRVPMVQIENVKIKSEPIDYDIYELDPIVENVNYISSMSSMTFSMNSVRNNNVNACTIGSVDQRYPCHNTFADCPHFNCNYGKNSSNNQVELKVDCVNGSKLNHKKDNNDNRCGIMNNLMNNNTNEESKDLQRTRHSLLKEKNALNIGNISTNGNQVSGVKIKSEMLENVERRSLRPRKKSVDYLGRKRKKDDNLIIENPAKKRSATNSDIKRKSLIENANDSIAANKVIHVIKKETTEEECGRSLRPRKLTIDYFGHKKRKAYTFKTDSQNRSKEVLERRQKSSNDFRKRSSGSGFVNKKNTELKVKEEIISYDELPDIEQENDTRYNIGVTGNHVRNLSNLFDQNSSKPSIKIEEDIDNEYGDRDRRINVTSSLASSGSMKLRKNKSMLKNIAAKQISKTNKTPPKYSKIKNSSLKNILTKKSEPDRLSLRNLNRKLSQLPITRSAIDNNLNDRIRETTNGVRVPTSFKIDDNIKHFCDKCCTSFINRELYTLHVCYYA